MVPEDLENNGISKVNGVTYRQRPPFGKLFELIYDKCISCINDYNNVSQKTETNICLHPKLIDFFRLAISHCYPYGVE